jgi:hypothetical protein
MRPIPWPAVRILLFTGGVAIGTIGWTLLAPQPRKQVTERLRGRGSMMKLPLRERNIAPPRLWDRNIDPPPVKIPLTRIRDERRVVAEPTVPRGTSVQPNDSSGTLLK